MTESAPVLDYRSPAERQPTEKRRPGNTLYSAFFVGATAVAAFLTYSVVTPPEPSPYPIPGIAVVGTLFFVLNSIGNLTLFIACQSMGRRMYSGWKLFAGGLLAGATYPLLCLFLYHYGPTISWETWKSVSAVLTSSAPLLSHSIAFAVLVRLFAVRPASPTPA